MPLSPEEKRAIQLIAVADTEAWADRQLTLLNGLDRPLIGGRGLGQQILHPSSRYAFHLLKERCATRAAALRNNAPLL